MSGPCVALQQHARGVRASLPAAVWNGYIHRVRTPFFPAPVTPR